MLSWPGRSSRPRCGADRSKPDSAGHPPSGQVARRATTPGRPGRTAHRPPYAPGTGSSPVATAAAPRSGPMHGLRGHEGTFSICTFWYVDALARSGRLEQARLAFEKMFTYANHLGLFAEEIGQTGEQLGNFPQAFTHLSLINAAVNLDHQLDHGAGFDPVRQVHAHGAGWATRWVGAGSSGAVIYR